MENFNARDLEIAIEELAMCKYFPSEAGTQAAIMRLLARIVPHKEALMWLVRTFADRIGQWHGPQELRAILCTRYRPADGIEAYSAIVGFTANDQEMAYIESHNARKPAQIAGDNREMLQLVDGLAKAKGIQ